MKYLQAPLPSEESTPKDKLLNILISLNLLAVLITFLLNFLGLPILKYHYLFHVLLTLISIILFDFSQIFPIILTLYFIEGQGRIIWEYANWARIIFDSLMLVSILKIFIVQKKIFDAKTLPSPLIMLIAAHFLWYSVEFFNPKSLSVFAVLAASKVYVMPLLLFFGISQIDFDVNGKRFQKHLNFFIILLALELGLTVFQFYQKEALVLQISPYYSKAMKDLIFTGKFYRPFSTTQLPGAISIFIFLTSGLLFLKKSTFKTYVLNIVLFSVSGWVLILCQVRSAFVKFILIIFAIYLGELIYLRFRSKSIIGIVFLACLYLLAPNNMIDNKPNTEDEGMEYATNRFSTLGDLDKIKGSRLSPEKFAKIVGEKLLEHPLGLAPGLTGAVGSMSAGELQGNPFINTGTVWASDNLIISLLIDFGVGAIFYLLTLVYIPFYFFRFILIFYRNKKYEPYKTLLVCFSTIVVVLIGNWGAIGLTYNPESFAFWFFSGLGFQVIAKQKKLHALETHV